MKIETKYDLGDFAYPISRHQKQVEHICEVCGGSGTLPTKKSPVNCPECYGKGYSIKWEPEKWHVSMDSAGHIGNIRVYLYSEKYENCRNEYRYMLDTTGIGSGTLWEEDLLFPSKVVAQAECDKRNSREDEDE